MKNNHYSGGFTLIELLVVVLIIGILSSVALPQYTKAVEKSRASEAMTYADAWIKASQIHHMANGGEFYDGLNPDLDIALPNTLKNFTVGAEGGGDSAFLYLRRNSTSSMYYMLGVSLLFWPETGIYTVSRGCFGNEKACKAISNGAACSHDGEDGDVPWCYMGNYDPQFD